MSLATLYKSQVKSAQAKVKSTRATRDRKRSAASTPKERLTQLERSLRQARSESQRQNLERQIDGKSKEVTRAEDALGRAETDLSKAEEALDSAQQKLVKQEEADEKTAERLAKQEQQRREREKRLETQRRERADRERTAREASQDVQIENLHARASELEERLLEAERQKAPSDVTVLFLAASPEDEAPLRLDKETRVIQKRMRSTKFRDSIFIEWRPARQVPDLIQDLNEIRLDVLHFSGHGNSKQLAFEDANGKAVPLPNDQLDRLLDAAPAPIRLVLFNSCNSAAQAELATKHVELAIGMDATVEDEVAQVFAGQFYNSLGFGLSVAKAFDQAKFQVESELGGEFEVPRLFAADGVNPNVVVLVNPD